jgi:hypothetical protein
VTDAAAWQEVAVPLLEIPTGTGSVVLTSSGGVDLDQVEFTTSVGDIRSLLAALGGGGRVTTGALVSLAIPLDRAAAALAAGQDESALAELQTFASQVPNRVREDDGAADLLLRAAEAVPADIEQRVAANTP